MDLLDLHRRFPDRYPFLLESTTGPTVRGEANSRYDILFTCPDASLWLDAGGLHGNGFTAKGDDFLANLDRWYAEESRKGEASENEASPFNWGWFLYLGYELSGQIEPVLRLPKPPGNLPTALAVRCHAALIRESGTGRTHLCLEPGHEDNYRQVMDDVEYSRRSSSGGMCGDDAPVPVLGIQEEEPTRFLEAVKTIQDYVRAGDVFQVNLSRQWDIRLPPEISSAGLYRRLRMANPAPFSGLMHWQDSALASSSPERLVRVQGRHVQTRPIAGTRPRVGGQEADRLEGDQLLRHPKERAEHIMLIDLERNDLGRVCVPGTVTVDELMIVESYAHVHHIVSNVSGQLRDEIGPGTVIRAVFPGGTITGCPKVRSMQIIAELEGRGRGAYTGSMGYLGCDGRLDLNILIRSLTWQQGYASLRAGAGIVVDSLAERELDETRAKARGLLKIFGHTA